MQEHALLAISPIYGRYAKQTKELQDYFSEYALIRYRVKVEIEYFIALCVDAKLPQLTDISVEGLNRLRNVIDEFSIEEAVIVKEIEKKTNHDVKSVEYFVKNKCDEVGLSAYREFVHFGLTSQDATNPALTLMIKEATQQVYKPLLEAVIKVLEIYFLEWKNIPMLAHTHGQPASPTRLGKEIL